MRAQSMPFRICASIRCIGDVPFLSLSMRKRLDCHPKVSPPVCKRTKTNNFAKKLPNLSGDDRKNDKFIKIICKTFEIVQQQQQQRNNNS